MLPRRRKILRLYIVADAFSINALFVNYFYSYLTLSKKNQAALE